MPDEATIQDNETPRPLWLRNLIWLLALLVTFGFPSVFGGSSCSYDDCDDDDAYHDDDDGDDDDDDDDYCSDDDDHIHPAKVPVAANDPYLLKKYELIQTSEDRRHPHAALVHIDGVTLFHEGGPKTYERADFEMFTSLLLVNNKELIGLPPGAGSLVFGGVEFLDDGIEVRYQQEIRRQNGSFEILKDTELLFRFDLVGNLVSIRNKTWVEF